VLTIYLARHGQNVDNANGILNGHRDEPLTELGVRQAQELAAHICTAGLHFDHIFSSPLSRALQTASAVAESGAGPAPEVLPDLIERDFGWMTGKEISRITELCEPHILVTDTIVYFLDAEGGENFPQVLERAGRVLKSLMEAYADGTILLVGHGDFGKMLYASYYGLGWEEVLRSFHFGNSELLILSPESAPNQAHVFQQEQHNA